jgi:hypothetical protein
MKQVICIMHILARKIERREFLANTNNKGDSDVHACMHTPVRTHDEGPVEKNL